MQPSAVFAAAPHPNAVRLFQNYLFSVEGQELFVNLGGLRSLHTLVKDKPGRTQKTTPPPSKRKAKRSSGIIREFFMCDVSNLCNSVLV